MKQKVDTYPPLKLVQSYSEHGDISWEQLDQIRNIARKKTKVSDEIYITMIETVGALNYFNKIKPGRLKEAVSIATVMSALAGWRLSKQVYRFDETMEKMLYMQAGDYVLPVEVLRNLPYTCFYIEAPNLDGKDLHGFFVYLDMDNELRLYLRFLMLEHDAQKFQTRTIELVEGKTLREGMASPLKKQEQMEDIDEQLDQYILLTERMLQLVLYVCAQNADIEPKSVYQSVSPNRLKVSEVKDRYREVSEWDVGTRVIRDIESKRNSSTFSSPAMRTDKQSYHMAPHVRKGHWHTYWAGKKDGSEERRRIIKWIPFTYINVKRTEKLPITINRIRDKK